MANKLDQDIFEITDNFTWFAGSNVFTFGTHNELFGFENLYIRNMYGYYEFANVSEFARGNPSNYQISYSLTSNPLQSAKFKAIQYGLYGQVESSILPNLKVTAGVRVDIPTLPDKPSYNRLIDSTFGGLYNTNVVPSGNILWSPRLGFNWDVNNDKMTQVRGGAGIFSGRVPYVWISNQYGNTGVEFARLSANNLGPGFFTADPYNQPRPGAAFPALSPVATTEVDLTAKDFKMPQLLRYDLALDRQLPFDLIGTIEVIYSSTLNDLVYQDINQRPIDSLAYDGRPLMGRPAATGTSTTVNKVDRRDFTNVLLLKNNNDGYQWSVTADTATAGNGLLR